MKTQCRYVKSNGGDGVLCCVREVDHPPPHLDAYDVRDGTSRSANASWYLPHDAAAEKIAALETRLAQVEADAAAAELRGMEAAAKIADATQDDHLATAERITARGSEKVRRRFEERSIGAAHAAQDIRNAIAKRSR